MKVRYFIVGPTGRGITEGDHLYIVCSTTNGRSFSDIYMNDLFIDECFCGSRQEAVDFCKKEFGCKRVSVLD